MAAHIPVAALIASLLAVSGVLSASPANSSPPGSALAGSWVLDLGRTHYGPGVEHRRWERFTCVPRGDSIECRIDGLRDDGRRVRGGFTAHAEGVTAPVFGVPGMDAVQLRTISATIADATFFLRGTPAFGYRAYRGAGGRTLTIVAVDPVSRIALTSVVVYERR